MEILSTSNDEKNGNATMHNHSFRLMSHEVQEIISQKPHWLVRNGIFIFFLVILMLLAASYLIKYPDVVVASAKLTSVNAPKEIPVKTNGKLVKLFVQENEKVKANQLIGYIESTVNYDEANKLENDVEIMQSFLAMNDGAGIQSLFKNIRHNQLGELQFAFQEFAQAFLNYRNYLSNGFYIQKRKMLSADAANINKLNKQLNEQKTIHIEDLNLTQKTFSASQSLKDDGVISALELRNEKSKLLSKEMAIPQIENAIIANAAQQAEKQKEIVELENTIAQQKIVFTQALGSFKSKIEEWKQKYILLAPVDGVITFTDIVEENQQVKAGQVLCYVNPGNTEYYAQMNIPQANFGKVRTGQQVLLKFPSYAYREFGAVKAQVSFISHIATDSGYPAKILLTNGLVTNYNHHIRYSSGLRAQAEIVTKDQRLLQRLFVNVFTTGGN